MSQPINSRPWTVQARRGSGKWISIPGESYARREQAQHRMGVFRALVDGEFRVVHIKTLPREEEN